MFKACSNNACLTKIGNVSLNCLMKSNQHAICMVFALNLVKVLYFVNRIVRILGKISLSCLGRKRERERARERELLFYGDSTTKVIKVRMRYINHSVWAV